MKTIIYFLTFVALLTSCTAPRVFVQLTPEAPQGHFEMGREYISLTNDSIDIELGYDGSDGDQLVFDFVVINRTPKTLAINPSDFYYVVLDSASADSSKFPPRMAVHPDRVLYHFDENMEAREEARDVNSLLGFLEAGVGLLANTAAFLATDNPGYMVDAVFGTLETAGAYMTHDKQIRADIDYISSEKEIVTEEILKPGEVPPGKVASGYVYFPRHPETEYYMFCFPLEDQLFQFVYRQRKVYQYF